jgi:hypothetical protein
VTRAELADNMRAAVIDEMSAFTERLALFGITWTVPELEVWNSAELHYSAEVRVEFNRDGNLLDIFEFFVVQDGSLIVSELEMRQWLAKHTSSLLLNCTSKN